MCDTICLVGTNRTLFAKNSDRPVGEVQVVERLPARPAGGRLRTQYLEIDDAGAAAVLGSRPEWLWGLEHGVNEHGVAVGNEKVWTVDDPYAAEPALIGMDLVRLGLERGRTADEALDVMTALLERHGQGGVADASADEPYWSSFLVADAAGAWILETSGRTWAAKPVDHGAAISNRISLGTDWTRASADVPAGADFDRWRDPASPTGHADRRLAVTGACATTGAAAVSPRDLAAVMRHHGGRTWGAPGRGAGPPEPPPETVLPDGSGVTVCMHIRAYQATAASMIAELPAHPDAPRRVWVAVGSPCVTVYVPALAPGPAPAPAVQADAGTWKLADALRERVEADPEAIEAVRTVLDPIEAALWDEADALADRHGSDPQRWERFTAEAGHRLEEALRRLA